MLEAIEKIEQVNFVDRLCSHPFFLIRFLGWILNSIWMVLNIIGGLVAWFVAMVAAG